MRSFIVRLWVPSEEPRPVGDQRLCGVLEHIGDGRNEMFSSGDQLLRLLTDSSTSVGSMPVSPNGEGTLIVHSCGSPPHSRSLIDDGPDSTSARRASQDLPRGDRE